MINNDEPAILSLAEFTDGGETGLISEIEDVERAGIVTSMNRERYEITLEPRHGMDWKDVATRAFNSLKAIGLAAFNDTIEDRCELMGTWKECAMDVLGYTKFE